MQRRQEADTTVRTVSHALTAAAEALRFAEGSLKEARETLEFAKKLEKAQQRMLIGKWPERGDSILEAGDAPEAKTCS